MSDKHNRILGHPLFELVEPVKGVIKNLNTRFWSQAAEGGGGGTGEDSAAVTHREVM